MDPATKRIKSGFVELFKQIAQVFFFWLPGDELKGYALVILHLITGLSLVVLFLISQKSAKIAIAIFFFIVLIQQYLFRGCVVTKAEQHLTKNSVTIFDPIINMTGIEPTNELRFISSFSSVLTTFLIMTSHILLV